MNYAMRYELMSELYDERVYNMDPPHPALEEAGGKEGFFPWLWRKIKELAWKIVNTLKRFFLSIFGTKEQKSFIKYAKEANRVFEPLRERLYTCLYGVPKILDRLAAEFNNAIKNSTVINGDYSANVNTVVFTLKAISTESKAEVERVASSHSDWGRYCKFFGITELCNSDFLSKIKTSSKNLISVCESYAKSLDILQNKPDWKDPNKESELKRSIQASNTLNASVTALMTAINNFKLYVPIYMGDTQKHHEMLDNVEVSRQKFGLPEK